METITDVPHFLNYLDFVGDLGSTEYSNFNRVKNVLTNNLTKCRFRVTQSYVRSCR